MINDYKYEELISDLKDELSLVKKYKKNCEKEMSKHDPIFKTDDKFEIKLHEYWRATIVELDKQISFLETTLEKQDILMTEEIEQMAKEEEFIRELRFGAEFGI